MSVLVAVKLNSEASIRLLNYVSRSVAATWDTIHVTCVIIQQGSAEEQRVKTQQQMRQQFGALLKGRPHRLHIVRVIQRDAANIPSARWVAEALCAKAIRLASSVMVVGAKACNLNSGAVQCGPVAESIRKADATPPMLLVSHQHPMLADSLPAIAEEAAYQHCSHVRYAANPGCSNEVSGSDNMARRACTTAI